VAASVQEELTRMRIILQDLEGRLEAGEVPPEGLPEFKSTVDEIRLRVWALLTAAGAEAPREGPSAFGYAARPSSAARSPASCPPAIWVRVTRSGPKCSRR
jgi:hypothetical protein